jgi:hypothetical protein
MTVRNFGILPVLVAIMSAPSRTMAQAPAPAMQIYTGSLGGGLALTGGNTDTRNYNLTGEVVRDPKTKNVIKGTGSYLRGLQSDILNVDRAAIKIRDEYSISNRTFLFGQLDYLRDQFKQIIFFWAPTAGIGYKLINTNVTQFVVDGGGGGLLEKNPGIPSSKSGSVIADERFERKLSSAATFTEALSTIWKTKDFWRLAHDLFNRYNNNRGRQDSTESGVHRHLQKQTSEYHREKERHGVRHNISREVRVSAARGTPGHSSLVINKLFGSWT